MLGFHNKFKTLNVTAKLRGVYGICSNGKISRKNNRGGIEAAPVMRSVIVVFYFE
jgi:hypothetical protein